jgi:hypothetical protein
VVKWKSFAAKWAWLQVNAVCTASTKMYSMCARISKNEKKGLRLKRALLKSENLSESQLSCVYYILSTIDLVLKISLTIFIQIFNRFFIDIQLLCSHYGCANFL